MILSGDAHQIIIGKRPSKIKDLVTTVIYDHAAEFAGKA